MAREKVPANTKNRISIFLGGKSMARGVRIAPASAILWMIGLRGVEADSVGWSCDDMVWFVFVPHGWHG